VPEDTDSTWDIYERHGGVTTLVSTGPTGGNGSFDVDYQQVKASKDLTHVVFLTAESLVPGDTDSNVDLYERSGGQTTLASTGPSGGNGPWDVYDGAVSEDGSHVFFRTQESLVPSDNDNCGPPCYDVYQRTGGRTTLISTGPASGGGFDADFKAVSADGSRVFFETREPLVASDTDGGMYDVYERSGGQTSLVSTGPTSGNDFGAHLTALSSDGGHVFFDTSERLVPADTDSSLDLYERTAGATNLVSIGPAGGNGNFNVGLAGHGSGARASSDGSRVFFTTAEPLVSGDTDTSQDVYERFAGQTYWISAGSAGGADNLRLGFPWPITPDGRTVLWESQQPLAQDDTDSALDLYAATVGAYPRPKGATPLFVSLVPAFDACTSPNVTHGAPLAFQACSPPDQTSARLTVGSPDANGAGANSIGSARYRVLPANSETPANEADVRVSVSITDVREQGTLADYTGELRLDSSIRITDEFNGSSQTEPGTADADFPVTVPCAATSSTTIGGTCEATTTFNAILPGTVLEGKRSIWQLGTVNLFDGGSDGVASTTPNALFATQGVFVP
jgi:hypothetical protein